MLADGFEIERAGALVTGGLFIVVVVVGATVVGGTTVVGGGVVVVGLGEPFEAGREFRFEVAATTCEWRTTTTLATCVTRRAIVVVVGATVVVVVAAIVVVVPMPSLALGATTFAMAGSAVVLKMIPRTSEPNEPMSTERRGPRREVEERPLGSPVNFCPCVKFVMNQLSKINSKVPPTAPQYLPNSIEGASLA